MTFKTPSTYTKRYLLMAPGQWLIAKSCPVHSAMAGFNDTSGILWARMDRSATVPFFCIFLLVTIFFFVFHFLHVSCFCHELYLSFLLIKYNVTFRLWDQENNWRMNRIVKNPNRLVLFLFTLKLFLVIRGKKNLVLRWCTIGIAKSVNLSESWIETLSPHHKN